MPDYYLPVFSSWSSDGYFTEMAASILYDVIVFAPVKFWYGFFLGVGPFSQGRDSGVEQRRGNVTHAEHGVKHLRGHKMLFLIMQGFEGFILRMFSKNFNPFC